jgi:hypothetical protein
MLFLMAAPQGPAGMDIKSVSHEDPERVHRHIDHIDLRSLDTDPIAIVPDRARQSRLRDSDEAGGDDHRGYRNSPVAHGIVPQPQFQT